MISKQNSKSPARRPQATHVRAAYSYSSAAAALLYVAKRNYYITTQSGVTSRGHFVKVEAASSRTERASELVGSPPPLSYDK
jgi:hypothetical protein